MNQEQGGNLLRVKVQNYNAIRRIIYQYGPLSRSDISTRLSLTISTITSTVNNMISNGLVRNVELSPANQKVLGRKAYPVDIDLDARLFAGVEIRGTYRRACVCDYRGKILFAVRDDTLLTQYESAIDSACHLIQRCLCERSISPDRIVALGVSLPGLVNTSEGILRIHPGYNWKDKPIRDDIIHKTGFQGQITVENNVCGRAYAARLFRRELMEAVPSFSYLFVSGGIACPLISNTGPANCKLVGVGEVGHIVMAANGPPCSCGNYGCLEAFSSEKALIAKCNDIIRKGNAPILADACNGEPPDIDAILKAYQDREPMIVSAVETAIYYLGLAMANIDNFVRPHTMLFEGKLLADEQTQKPFLDIIKANLYRSTLEDINFHFIPPDDFSGALGACAAAILWDLNNYIPSV